MGVDEGEGLARSVPFGVPVQRHQPCAVPVGQRPQAEGPGGWPVHLPVSW
jgi:hypothetical protein